MSGSVLPLEYIVVDDASTDDSRRTALRHGATVIPSTPRRGPAYARNLGARAARGDVILFLDADVRPAVDTLQRVRAAFAADDGLDAVIGSYDDAPSSPGFVSQYKNLMHCFVHQNANRTASTFWSGCGAIRRQVFLELGGFDESYDHPAIEDIELGYRLVAARGKITLDPGITVKHLKRWTLWGMVRCDIFDRGVPWTELIWRDRLMPNDLNLRTSQRVSVGLVCALLAVSGPAGWKALQQTSLPTEEALLLGLLGLWSLGIASIVALNVRFFRFLAQRRGAGFAVSAVPMQIAFYIYSGFAFAIGSARYVAGLVQSRAEVEPLEADQEPATAKSA